MRLFSLFLFAGFLALNCSLSFAKQAPKKTGGYVKTYKVTKKQPTHKKTAEKTKYKSKEVQDFMDGKTNNLREKEKL